MQETGNAKRETRRQRIRQQKRRRVVVLAVLVVVAALVIFGLVKLFGWIFTPKYVPSANIGPLPPAEGEEIVITAPPKYYDYASPVPEAEAVGDEFFDSVLMIGDARVAGFPIYNLLTGADYLSDEYLHIYDILSDDGSDYSFENGDTPVTLSEQLASKAYGAVYLQIGVNDLGMYEDPANFAVDYAEVVEFIKSNNPGASIYLQPIIPLAANAENSSAGLTNAKVAEYNVLIKQTAEAQRVYYLDIANGLSGGTGVLTSGYASGGASLSVEGYEAWINYMRTHVVNEEIYS